MSNSAENLFRENLKKYRKMKNFTQVKLSVYAGLSEDYISQIECGRRSPSLATITCIAETLDVEVKDLFTK